MDERIAVVNTCESFLGGKNGSGQLDPRDLDELMIRKAAVFQSSSVPACSPRKTR